MHVRGAQVSFSGHLETWENFYSCFKATSFHDVVAENMYMVLKLTELCIRVPYLVKSNLSQLAVDRDALASCNIILWSSLSFTCRTPRR